MTPVEAPTAASAQAVADAARRLQQAEADGRPGAPVRDLIGADGAAAYAVQEQVVAERLAAGRRVVGRKIGLTSPAVQAQLGVDRPDFGVLLDDMDVSTLRVVPMRGLLQPRVEAEIAFVLGDDLAEGPLDDVQARDAVRFAAAALEIVDSRIAGWDITYADTVADNASSGLFVLGTERVDLGDLETAAVEMRLAVDGVTAVTGNGAACLGDPINALVWLARTMRDLGEPLRAGQIVLSGALGPMVDVTAGTTVSADITGLGSVTATFSEETS